MVSIAPRERWLLPALTVCCVLVYVPFAGCYGLWDPWETHFAEVARQMAMRGDVISLHYPCSQLESFDFYTKPVLTFWLEAPMLWLFGATDGATVATSWRAEWAVRLPHVILAISTVGITFAMLRRLLVARVALLCAAILATCPSWMLLAHQAMTDMPFVSTMTVALLLVMAALLDEDGPAPRAGLLVAVATCGALPLALITAQLRTRVAMVPYWVALVIVVVLVGRLRSRRDVYVYGAWLCCGLATLAKGPAGLALPGITLLVYATVERRWRDLAMFANGGLLVFVVVAFPWYHAMHLRHGMDFWRELIGDNYLNRAMGRHGDRGTFEYYAQWTCYGTFPWSGLAAVGVLRALAARGTDLQSRLLRFCGAWILVDWTVLTLVTTKFHHYLLPMTPAVAIVAGITMRRAQLLYAVPLTLLAGLDLAHLPQRLTWLFDYDYVNMPGLGRPWPSPAIYADRFTFGPTLLAFALVGAALLCLRRPFVLAVAILFNVYVVDVMLVRLSPHWSQKHVIASYYAQRRSADEPLLVWKLFWHGENFYTANEIFASPEPKKRTVFLGDHADDLLHTYLRDHDGRRIFFLVERAKLEALQGVVGPQITGRLRVADDSNNKLILVEGRTRGRSARESE